MESYADIYRLLHSQAPPSKVTIGTSDADILSPSRGFMTGFDYTMQIQVGCPGGCHFCYVPSGSMLAPPAVRGKRGNRWGFEVRNKARSAQKLQRHLNRGILADKTIYWSGVTDPYAASPTTTRSIWHTSIDTPKELRPKRIVVQTRFRPDRNSKLIGQYALETKSSDGGPSVVISYSIGTDRNDLIRSWERATPLFEKRIHCVDSLCRENIFVVVTHSPCGLWTDLQAADRQLQELGVKYLTVLFFKCGTKSANTPKLFQEYLRSHTPEVFDAGWQSDRLAEMQSVYGKNRVIAGQEGFASLGHPHTITD